jgi:hypothetical protein
MPTCNSYSVSRGRRARLLGSTIAATLLISAFGSADAQDQPPPAQPTPAAPAPAQTAPAPSGPTPQSPPAGEQAPGGAAPALPPVTVVKPTPTRRPAAGKPQPTPGRQEAVRPQPTPARQEAVRPGQRRRGSKPQGPSQQRADNRGRRDRKGRRASPVLTTSAAHQRRTSSSPVLRTYRHPSLSFRIQ